MRRVAADVGPLTVVRKVLLECTSDGLADTTALGLPLRRALCQTLHPVAPRRGVEGESLGCGGAAARARGLRRRALHAHRNAFAETVQHLVRCVLQPRVRPVQLARRLARQLTQLIPVVHVGQCAENKIGSHHSIPPVLVCVLLPALHIGPASAVLPLRDRMALSGLGPIPRPISLDAASSPWQDATSLACPHRRHFCLCLIRWRVTSVTFPRYIH